MAFSIKIKEDEIKSSDSLHLFVMNFVIHYLCEQIFLLFIYEKWNKNIIDDVYFLTWGTNNNHPETQGLLREKNNPFH